MIYGVLTDPEKRKLYDERGEIGIKRKEKEDCACPEQKPKAPREPGEVGGSDEEDYDSDEEGMGGACTLFCCSGGAPPPHMLGLPEGLPDWYYAAVAEKLGAMGGGGCGGDDHDHDEEDDDSEFDEDELTDDEDGTFKKPDDPQVQSQPKRKM